ncbi:hypothetical protein [Paramaledivibacter caminithermalis]|jgi:hypothetical protein|uniref:Uncharacterized protein n=1 Tax=Paramaledivibacter caminithermalis (strain DSM 15212 / CIP 107654 / DViRD3) TaxID=1121301 RepID=A0A1M6U927_PARC5|nr:hypothetical protein [Paramaledivibacter caminithermalis]SHK65676.1 hypothetical protein SAMN02745912_03898 [Paramaledivibacter caminithermalis DSM 15212]
MRKVLSLVLVICLFSSLGVTSFAVDGNFDGEFTVIGDELSREEIEKIKEDQIQKEIQKEINKSLTMDNSYEISPRSIPEWEYKSVKVGSAKARKVPIGFAGKQPRDGIVFEDKGGRIHWQDSGFEKNVSFSVSIAGELVSVGVSAAAGKKVDKVTGYSARVPDIYVGKPVKLFVSKDFEVTKFKLMRRKVYGNTGEYGKWEYVKSFTTEVPVRPYLKIKKVEN